MIAERSSLFFQVPNFSSFGEWGIVGICLALITVILYMFISAGKREEKRIDADLKMVEVLSALKTIIEERLPRRQ